MQKTLILTVLLSVLALCHAAQVYKQDDVGLLKIGRSEDKCPCECKATEDAEAECRNIDGCRPYPCADPDVTNGSCCCYVSHDMPPSRAVKASGGAPPVRAVKMEGMSTSNRQVCCRITCLCSTVTRRCVCIRVCRC